jgi:type II secretory pathway component PulF
MPEAVSEKRSVLNQPIFERVTKEDIAVFSRQLSLLLDVGMPLLKALRTLAKRTTTQKLAGIIDEIADSVEQGNTFANALSEHQNLFSPVYINIVRVGEVGGSLEQALRRLARFTERSLRNRRKLVNALMYPVIVMAIAVVVIVIILTFVFPQMLAVFEGNEDKLPMLTRAMAAIGDFFAAYWGVLLILVIAAIAGLAWFRKTPTGKRMFDAFFLNMRLPMAGRLGQKVIVSRVAETFSLLLKSGVQLIPAMRVVAGASGCVQVEERLLEAADEVEEGKNIQDSLIPKNIFPPLVVDMIGVGEEAGSLDTVLDRIHESYDEEVDLALDSMNRVIEPIFIVFLGGALLLIALAVFLPYWNIGSALTFE